MARGIYSVASTVPNAISVRMLNQGLHIAPLNLREKLQTQIDAIEPDECDAIVLAYGICGTSTLGLSSPHTPLVIPRAHDCIALYLGSLKRYQEEFDSEPGTYWYSVDYMERKGGGGGLGASFAFEYENLFDEFVERYGKDNAEYLMEEMSGWGQHYKRAAFIDTGADDIGDFQGKARAQAEKRGWKFESKKGNNRLMELLLSGNWPEDEFLVVPPGQRIAESYDEKLMVAAPVEEKAEEPSPTPGD